MSYPSISLIIPTYRREQILRDTLDDVLKQDYPNVEILVIDQTETHDPKIQTYLENLAKTDKIKLFRVSWASLPAARNYGVRRSQGEIIIFIDDDVQLPENYLYTHAKVYQENLDVGAVAGRVLDRMKLADSEKIHDSQDPYTVEILPPEAMDPGIAWYHIDLVHTTKPQEVIPLVVVICHLDEKFLLSIIFGSMKDLGETLLEKNRIFVYVCVKQVIKFGMNLMLT